MRFLSIILLLIASVADAQQLLVVKLSDNKHVAFEVDAAGGYKFLGTYTSVRGIGDTPDPPLPPPVTTKPTRAVYVYEKDQGAVPPQVAGALNALNKQALDAGSGFVAAEFEDDTVDGTGQVPDQFKVAREAALKEGLPCLVVLSGEKVVRVVKAPKTAVDVEKAVKP